MNEIKLNLGCGGRPMHGYINVDMDDADAMRKRYPSHTFAPDLKIYQYDLFKLPYKDGTVDEVVTAMLMEHLSFSEEPLFLREVQRVLRSGGVFKFTVPDFEALVKAWLAAKDDWKDFYREDDEAIAQKHWFGTYSYGWENRWGYLIAGFYGNQHGPGQFHKNCYSEGKVRAMLTFLGFENIEISRGRWQGDRDVTLEVKCQKI